MWSGMAQSVSGWPGRLNEAAMSLSVDRISAEVVRAMDAAGVETVLLKGPALLHRLYDAGEHRPYVDCDLLVPGATERLAASVLRQLGFTPARGFGPPDPGVADQHEWHRERDHVDLHVSFYGIRAPADVVWPTLAQRLESLIVGGHRMRVLGEGPVALLLALHVASDGPAGEKALEDLRRGLERFDEACWKEAEELARRLDALPALGAGLSLLPAGARLVERLGLDPGYDISVALRAAGAPPLAGSLERLRREPTLGGKLRRIARVLLPTPTYIRRWAPLAQRGPLGLVLAYLWRPIWLAGQFGPGLRAWLQARKGEGGRRC